MQRPSLTKSRPAARHAEQRGRAGEDVDDARADLDALGDRGEVAHLADRVERVRLRDPHDVEAGLLEVDDLLRRLLEPARVAELHAELHGSLPLDAGSVLDCGEAIRDDRSEMKGASTWRCASHS